VDMRVLKQVMATALLIALSNLVAIAQSASVGGPILGFVGDEHGASIWPVLGVLGASVLGERLELPSRIVRATIAPKNDYALAVQKEDGQAVIINLDIGSPAVVPLPSALTNVTLVQISPIGTAAALYAADSKRLQVFSGLPSAPSVAFEFDASILPGDIVGVAVSDDAQLGIVSVGNSENNSLWAVNASGAWLLTASGRSLMTFLAHRHDAVVVEDALQEVSLLQDIDGSPSRLPLFMFTEEPQPFSGVAISGDGRTVFVIQHGSENITMLDLETGSPAVQPCGCKPRGLFPLKDAAAFRLNGMSSGPITVLDVSSQDARIVLIPPHPEGVVTLTESQ
jgi:hypothetical protein